MPRRKSNRSKAATAAPSDVMQGLGLKNHLASFTKEMPEKERREQFRIFLKDFDHTVRKHMRNFDRHRVHFMLKSNNALTTCMQQFPESIRDITVKDFLAGGCDVLSVEKLWLEANGDTEEYNRLIERRKSSIQEPPTAMDMITEEDSCNDDVGALRTTTKRGKAKRKASTRYVTPAGNVGKVRRGATPMITPKIDPYSVTEQLKRELRPGELAYTLTGTPVKLPPVTPFFAVPKVGGGTTMFDTSKLSPPSLQQMIDLFEKKIVQ